MIEQFKYAEIVGVGQDISEMIHVTNSKELNEELAFKSLPTGVYVIKLYISRNRFYAIDFIVEF